jgi:hypothetical protein
MTTLTKEYVNTQDEVVYFYYKLPDISGFSRWDQAKPLLESIKDAFTLIETQTKGMHQKYINILKEHDQELQGTRDQLTSEQNKLKEEQKQQKHDDSKEHTEAQKDKIANLEKRVGELIQNEENLKKQLSESANDEDEIRTQLVQARDEIKDFESTSSLTASTIEALSKEIAKLRSQLANQEPTNQTTDHVNPKFKQLNEALQKALTRININDTVNSKTKSDIPTITIEDDENKKKNKNIKIKINTTLPTFHGRPDENVNEWLYSITRTLEVSDYTDAEKVTAASNYLRSFAQQDYICHEQLSGKDTWESFQEYMKKRFVPANHEELIRNKVKQLKQITNVKEYYVEFRKLTIQSSEMNEGEKRHCFLDGLRPEVAKWVRLREPKTIEVAYEKAVLFETFETDDKSKTSFMASNNRSQNNSNKTATETIKIETIIISTTIINFPITTRVTTNSTTTSAQIIHTIKIQTVIIIAITTTTLATIKAIKIITTTISLTAILITITTTTKATSTIT